MRGWRHSRNDPSRFIRYLDKTAARHMPITHEIDRIVAKVTVGGAS